MSRYPRTPIATKPTRRRSSYLLHHDFVRLDDWCHKVRELVGDTPYHVGSSTQRDGWRDVDLRVIMADDDFDRQYAGQPAQAPLHQPGDQRMGPRANRATDRLPDPAPQPCHRRVRRPLP